MCLASNIAVKLPRRFTSAKRTLRTTLLRNSRPLQASTATTCVRLFDFELVLGSLSLEMYMSVVRIGVNSSYAIPVGGGAPS